MPTDSTELAALVSLISAHGWLGLIAMITLYARKVLSPASGFPVNVNPRWLPTVTAVGALATAIVGGLQAHESALTILLGAAVWAGSGGFLDGLLVAIFDHDNAPKWARLLVMVFDDVTTGGGSGGGTAKTPRLTGGKAFGVPPTRAVPAPTDAKPIAATPPTSSVPPPAPAKPRLALAWRLAGAVLVAAPFILALNIGTFAVTGLTGCTAAQWQSFATNASQFVEYVHTFLDGIAAVWDVVSTLIPAASLPTATAAYNDARLAVNSSLAAVQDAISAGNAVQAPPPNYPALIAAVQGAVAQLMNIVTQWQPVATGKSAPLSAVAHESQVIAAWK